MTGVVFMLQTLALVAFLPSLSLGLALDTCEQVCRDKEFLHDNCYGEVCVLLQPGYDRGVIPEMKGGVMQVEAYIKVQSVTDIDPAMGLLTVTFDLQLAWRDQGLSVCNCMGNQVRAEYQMDGKLKEKIWRPRFYLLKGIFNEDNDRKGLLVEDHKDSVEIFMNYQITTTVDCDFSEQLRTYPFGRTMCLIQLEEKYEPLSVVKFNTTLLTTDHHLNELNAAYKIKQYDLSRKELRTVPDFSKTGEYHSCTGFALKIWQKTDASTAYVLVSLGLACMAAFSVNLMSDKLSPLAITIVSGLTIYLDGTKIYHQPVHGLSFLNIFGIVSNLVLLLPFIGLIISSKKRWQKQFVNEEEGMKLEKEADEVEQVTTVAVPFVEVLVVVIFYVAGANTPK